MLAESMMHWGLFIKIIIWYGVEGFLGDNIGLCEQDLVRVGHCRHGHSEVEALWLALGMMNWDYFMGERHLVC